MMIYLTALNRTVHKNENIHNVKSVLNEIWNHSFNGKLNQEKKKFFFLINAIKNN